MHAPPAAAASPLPLLPGRLHPPLPPAAAASAAPQLSACASNNLLRHQCNATEGMLTQALTKMQAATHRWYTGLLLCAADRLRFDMQGQNSEAGNHPDEMGGRRQSSGSSSLSSRPCSSARMARARSRATVTIRSTSLSASRCRSLCAQHTNNLSASSSVQCYILTAATTGQSAVHAPAIHIPQSQLTDTSMAYQTSMVAQHCQLAPETTRGQLPVTVVW
jgi:hypothetical protein